MRIPIESWICASISWLCSMLFFFIAHWARTRKEPMHFWAGSSISPHSIRDIPAYNRAHARMWDGVGLFFLLCGGFAFLSSAWAGLILGFGTLLGLPVLIFLNNRIYKKYKRI